MNDKRFWPLLIFVLALVTVGLACGSSAEDEGGVRTLTAPTANAQDIEEEGQAPAEDQATDTPEPTTTPSPTDTPEVEGLVKVGTHLVGTDIEPGIYVGVAGENLMESCYWARLSNLTGSDDILANDNALGLFYVEVLPEDRALETACELLPLENVPPRGEFLTVLPPGTYIVGRDIEPGTYRGQAGEDILDSCYWARLRNVSGQGDIIANDNATGQYFVEVTPSDFALQVGCEVERVE